MDPDLDPGGPKTRGSGRSGPGFGSGSTTLAYTVIVLFRDQWKKEKRHRLAAARESALSNEQAMIESRYPVNRSIKHFYKSQLNWGFKLFKSQPLTETTGSGVRTQSPGNRLLKKNRSHWLRYRSKWVLKFNIHEFYGISVRIFFIEIFLFWGNKGGFGSMANIDVSGIKKPKSTERSWRCHVRNIFRLGIVQITFSLLRMSFKNVSSGCGILSLERCFGSGFTNPDPHPGIFLNLIPHRGCC
jgi:hypothetical protein